MIGFNLPTFVCGVGSVLEVYPVPHLYNFQRHMPELSDAQRLAGDWNRVGQALYTALDAVAGEPHEQEEEQAARAEPSDARR